MDKRKLKIYFQTKTDFFGRFSTKGITVQGRDREFGGSELFIEADER